MKKNRGFLYHLIIFVIAQLAWLALLGIWIYWYVSNYIIYERVGDQVSPQLVYDVQNVFPFVGGLILLVGLSFSMVLIFRRLNIQIRLTRLYDNFIANVTHELKSPLSSIQLYLETLKSRNVPPEKQKEFIGIMMKDAGRLNNLINSILAISAIDQKKELYKYRSYNSDNLIYKLIEEVQDQFKLTDEGIEITGKANCDIRADYDSLKIVFDNLVDNSIKYTVGSVKIRIEFTHVNQKLVIRFIDNGIGIPLIEQKKIFSKFYRISTSDIPNVKGTGLGLYWVKDIIKSHKGKILVEKSHKDTGTIFRIELPVLTEKQKKEFKEV